MPRLTVAVGERALLPAEVRTLVAIAVSWPAWTAELEGDGQLRRGDRRTLVASRPYASAPKDCDWVVWPSSLAAMISAA